MTVSLSPPGSSFNEINLKQVIILLSQFYDIQNFHRLILLLFQAQDSPDNSMFSFQIGVASREEEEPSSAESAGLRKNIRTKLQEILHFLNQDIGRLVQDAEPIRVILKSLKGQLPESIEEALIPAAFIESRRVQVVRAQKRLADRFQQEQTMKQRDVLKGLVESTRSEIESLTCSQTALQKTKGELEAKHDFLLQELNRVNREIDVIDNDLSQIQPAVARLEGEKQEQARQAYQLLKSLQPIPGSADDDNRVIQEADEIRLRVMNVIQNSLGSL